MMVNMSANNEEITLNNKNDTGGQSSGNDPNNKSSSSSNSKRNSGLFALFKWFKQSTSRESIDSTSSTTNSSTESLNSIHSNGTAASFSFVHPSALKELNETKKCIDVGPETDTYKARLKLRDKSRENDKNLTLRKKYNLFFNRDTTLKGVRIQENTKSLPLITTTNNNNNNNQTSMEYEEKIHRRTNSESSKIRKAGAYLHVKGKRKAPQPPATSSSGDSSSTTSLRRRKRVAPAPPSSSEIEYADADIIVNDCLKLDHGVLKSVKSADEEQVRTSTIITEQQPSSVSPRPWYKRNTTNNKKEHKYEPIERLPEMQFTRNSSTIDLTIEDTTTSKNKNEKRKSGLTFLTNISELDREAQEIVNKKERNRNIDEVLPLPEFMRPKLDFNNDTHDPWVNPSKRRSARDLIAKFNAITNVTKVTVNSALFGAKEKRDYFGNRTSLSDDSNKRQQEKLLENHKKRVEKIFPATGLMKSESASAIKKSPDNKAAKTPERKTWYCNKCNLENEYWRIICQVCSAIKPYFDDFSSSDVTKKNKIEKPSSGSSGSSPERILERSKTQIGFSALANYNNNNNNQETDNNNKREEREKLKKMLIEMKNSLPKRNNNAGLTKQGSNNNRTSVIMEASENNTEDKTQETKVAEILIGTQETVYENIKVRRQKSETNKAPIKVSASAQTSSVVAKKILTTQDAISKLLPCNKPPKNNDKKNNFELMRPKDFEDIYSDKNNDGTSVARIYANLARNDELSLFFNMPKSFDAIKQNYKQDFNNTDTIEINRLLKRLETAIAKGELTEAAIFAKELAQLKVNCSVIRQKPTNIVENNSNKTDTGFNIEMFVEDKISHRGPFSVHVTENQTLQQLKKQIELEYEIPANVQRWILGKELATEDTAELKRYKLTSGCPVFLYLVAPVDAAAAKSAAVNPEEKLKNEASGSKLVTNEQTDKPQTKDSSIPKVVSVIPKMVESISKEQNKLLNYKSATNNETAPPVLSTQKSIEVKPNVVDVSNKVLPENKPNTTPNSYQINITQIKKEVVVNIPKIEAQPQNLTTVPKIEEKAVQITTIEPKVEDYDVKTLKPQPKTEWECYLCTLLNPISSNVCAVCATIRLPVAKKSVKKRAPQPQTTKNDETYLQLVHLDNADLVENVEPFECPVCFLEITTGRGITLRECLHQFCKVCLEQTVQFSDEAEVKCPYRDDQYSCNIAIQDREIKAIVKPGVYEQHLAKSVAQAENKIDKTFHCKTPDCKGWCIFEDNVNEFRCPVCKRVNCLTCQAIHIGLNCKQYQERMKNESEIDDDAKRTKEMLDEMVKKGEALTCPTCQVILMKKWGCDWLRCSMCKTEICWVTRGPRWGPAGKGDTSGGCQCGLNGVKCHPQCNYCH